MSVLLVTNVARVADPPAFCTPGIIFAFYHIAVVTVVVWYPNHTSVSNKPAHYHPIFELLSPLSFLLPALMLDFIFTYLPHIAERRGFRREEHAIIAGWTDKMRRLLLIPNPIRGRQVVRERKEEMDAWKKEAQLEKDELVNKTGEYFSRSQLHISVAASLLVQADLGAD